MVKTLTVIVVLALLAWPAVGQAQTVTVNWTEVYQQIDGFGAGDAFCPSSAGYNACNLTNAQADLFFSPTSGVGLSILRSQVPNDGSCATTCNMNDLGTMTKAVARGARVVAAPWSPPASMKSNGSLLCGGSFGTGTLLAGSYGAYATYLKNYVQQLVSNGITLYALSIQNEPDSCTGNSTYQTLWSAANFHDFILNNLGPTFAAAGLSTKIMFPEPVSTTFSPLANYANTCLNDSSCAAYVGIVATHDYTYAPAPYTNGGKPLWMSEVSDPNPQDPSITSALTYAGLIHTWLAVENAQAWMYWWLIDGDGNSNDNQGLVHTDGTISKRLYMIGNWSKFVRPGWNRIGTSGSSPSGVSISAYKDANGDFAIVAINQSGTDTPLNLALNGFTASLVTPWVTSASLNLAQQEGIPVIGGSFNATLPASSVTTFATTAGSRPEPPTITGVTIH